MLQESMALLCILFLAPTEDPAPKAGAATPRSVEVNGLERTYLEYVPENCPSPAPLVFVLHGDGNDAKTSEGYFQMNPVADSGGFIVVYPDGLEGAWDDGRGVAPGGTRNIDDIAFFRAMLEDVSKRHEVDRTRVFATGMSSGAMFCHQLARKASDMICAIAPVAGALAEPIAEEFRLERPVSILIVQGDADPIIPLEGGFVYPSGIHRRGRVASLEQTIAPYLEAAKIDGKPTITYKEDAKDDGTRTKVLTYPTGESQAQVVLMMVEGGGHNLPGRDRDFPEWVVGKAAQDFDGAREIWDFFSKCPPRSQTAK